MSLQDEAEALRSIPPFQALDAQQLKLLAFASERLGYQAGETLTRQGEAGDAVFVVLDGQVEVSIESDGVSRVVRLLGRHAFVGEIAVLRQVTRTATVTAATPVEALKIDRDVLGRLMRDAPALRHAIAAHMSQARYVYE
jgi:CRP-like cAMP-binding protein